MAATAPGVNGCGLLDPQRPTEYVLLRANGMPLPVTLDSVPILHYLADGSTTVELYVVKRVSGSLVLTGNRFELTTVGERTFDGVSRTVFPPTTNRDVGYFHGPDTLAIFEAQHCQWAARFSGDTALSMTDITGYHDFVVLEFSRVTPH
jgi:hypothetical protein